MNLTTSTLDAYIVRKRFQRIYFSGVVTACNVDVKGRTIYRIQYTDKDSEDVFLSELKRILSTHTKSKQRRQIRNTPIHPKINSFSSLNICDFLQDNNHKYITPNEFTIKKFINEISSIATISYYDKNPGEGCITCPCHAWMKTQQTFNEDTNHYTKSNLTELELLHTYSDFHTDNNLHRIQTFDISKQIPYSYILFKNKDDNRCRPLVSYYNHPLKRTLNMTSRALAYVLKI